MKRHLIIYISLALAVLTVIPAFHSVGHSQTGDRMRRATLSTGVVSLNNSQYARLIVANPNPVGGSRILRADLRLLQHQPSGQQGSLVRHGVADQIASGQITLAPGESISWDFDLEHATMPNVGAVSFFINVEAEATTTAEACKAPTATVTLEVHNKYADLAGPVSVWVWVECDKSYVWM